jgi:hypothetical protein
VRRVETRRQDRLAVTKAENDYDYAGQDPVNGYDLDGLMLARTSDMGDDGHTIIPFQGGIASPDTIATRLVGHTAAHAIASVSRQTAAFTAHELAPCLEGGRVGALDGPEGFAAGCAIGVGADLLLHSHNKVERAAGLLLKGYSLYSDVRTVKSFYDLLQERARGPYGHYVP